VHTQTSNLNLLPVSGKKPMSIDCLPVEVLQHILESVVDFNITRETGELRTLSTGFRNAHDNLVRNLYLRYRGQWVEGWYNGEFITCPSTGKQGSHGFFLNNTVIDVTGDVSVLRRGPLSAMVKLSRFTRLESLQTINSNGPIVFITPACFEVISGITSLLNLEVVGTNCDLDEMPRYLSRLCGLRTLKLTYCGKFTELGSMSHMTSLDTLSLASCRGLERYPEALRLSLSTAHHQLTVLNLFGLNDAVNDALMEVLMKSLPELKDLNIGKSAITDLTFTRSLTSERRLQPLRILRLEKCVYLTDIGLRALSQSYTKLEEFDIRHNRVNLSTAGCVHLLALVDLKRY
jgi:hypothetical protein